MPRSPKLAPLLALALALAGCADNASARSAVQHRIEAKARFAVRDSDERAGCWSNPDLAYWCRDDATLAETEALLDGGVPATCTCPPHDWDATIPASRWWNEHTFSIAFDSHSMYEDAQLGNRDEVAALLLERGARRPTAEVLALVEADDWAAVEEQVRRGVDLTEVDLGRIEYKRRIDHRPLSAEQLALLEEAGAVLHTH